MPRRGPGGRPQKADLVVVMQCADGYTGQLGRLPHSQVIRHNIDDGTCRYVRGKHKVMCRPL